MFAIIIGNPSGYMKWKSIDTHVWSSREEDAESITLRLVSISVLLKYIMLIRSLWKIIQREKTKDFGTNL